MALSTMMAATRMMPRPSAVTSSRWCHRWGVIDLVGGQGLERLLFGNFGTTFRVELLFALAIGSFCMAENTK